ncbi:fungal-specific transcription factor domain-containing protein [Mollisia scopiformis]|uniref:Fungal-specific transcription factor domain-containing protein n=1 Tax=Mollisia scopiformis TaxID=149040 RepID=A0A194X6X4_MOLSC|nr:fungal-specific transcription factor domain-containing protein [Mollisia scopiformis]KUJ15923.1 fungal-specific transcription factor domain-containing protein [Mollisia scopiformis]
MFTTFIAKSPVEEPTRGRLPARKKRAQVARACHWCRVHRVRCDSTYPCTSCRNRGISCRSEAVTEARTLPQAIIEIEELKQKVKELEGKLAHEKQAKLRRIPAVPPTPRLHDCSKPRSGTEAFNQHEIGKRCWEGIHARTARGQQTQWYGPSSTFYFIGRMSTYLRSILPSPLLDEQIQPNSASRSFASPIYSKKVVLEDNTWTRDASAREEYLTGIQEEYFLGMFWHSYHCTYQILDESEFKEHYKSLWTSAGHTRRPSALVDIVLAICMQYGVAFLPQSCAGIEKKTNVDVTDATIAGRWYYHRCQTLLTAELESPSISTLQSHILSAIYLCNASFQNMAHTTLATAIRIAHILGLHLEPPETMPRVQRELRKRIWWTLYTIESKTSMKLGRPAIVQPIDFMCSLPADKHAVASISGSNFAPVDERVSWLTYGVQLGKLILAARETYLSFYTKCDEIMAANNFNTIYNDPEVLESAADFIKSNMQPLSQWRDDVPEALKTKRKDAGERFSTDRSPLEVQKFAPLWLQRQRVFLELLYHNLSMNLYRPSICFTPAAHDSTPAADAHSVACVSHAMSITAIMHQLVTETEIMNGWHEAFQWQWNASLSTIGFILAYPTHDTAIVARKLIEDAISVLELLGNHFAIAASAATVARDLVAKADFLMNRHNGLALKDADMLIGPDQLERSHVDAFTNQQDNMFLEMDSNSFAGSMDFAFSHSFEWLTADSSSIADNWKFTQD